tara:strand:+ start:1371 stop:2225 length:855 start_codon:yes stop_codon:yes gene_type:complete
MVVLGAGEASTLLVGIILAILAFYFFVWPRVSMKKLPFQGKFQAQLTGVSAEFYEYVRRWMSWVSILALGIVIFWGLIVYYGLTAEKLTLWLAGSGAIVLLIISRLPEAENAIAAMTVFFRQQVVAGDEFDIVFPRGDSERLTFLNRNERFNYAQRFDGIRSVIEIPHTVWVQSLISNISRHPLRWTTQVPLRFEMALRDDILDRVDEFVVESAFSDMPPDQVQYNYMTKLKPEVWGHYPEQVLSIYTMLSSREYGFTHENAFLDGLYRVLDQIDGVLIAQGEN